MKSTIATWFEALRDVASFREALERYGDDFDMGTSEMQEFGEVALDRSSGGPQRKEAVDYEPFRICLLEKALRSLPEPERESWRLWMRRYGGTSAKETGGLSLARLESFEAAFHDLAVEIEALPKGLVKERFSGAMAVFFNALYLARREVERH